MQPRLPANNENKLNYEEEMQKLSDKDKSLYERMKKNATTPHYEDLRIEGDHLYSMRDQLLFSQKTASKAVIDNPDNKNDRTKSPEM